MTYRMTAATTALVTEDAFVGFENVDGYMLFGTVVEITGDDAIVMVDGETHSVEIDFIDQVEVAG